nr:MAG TPA: hypothetical protein [Caudoviricetes sp.]
MNQLRCEYLKNAVNLFTFSPWSPPLSSSIE